MIEKPIHFEEVHVQNVPFLECYVKPFPFVRSVVFRNVPFIMSNCWIGVSTVCLGGLILRGFLLRKFFFESFMLILLYVVCINRIRLQAYKRSLSSVCCLYHWIRLQAYKLAPYLPYVVCINWIRLQAYKRRKKGRKGSGTDNYTI